MALDRFSQKAQCCSAISAFRHEALEDFILLIDGAPQMMFLAIDGDKHLIKRSLPV